MILPDNLDITTLLVEKCTHTGASWLHRLSRRTEEAASSYLSTLKDRYRNFYSFLSADEVMNNIDNLIYHLSVDGSQLLGIALYKELKTASLESAYHKQKDVMAMYAVQKPAKNILLQMKNRAVNVNAPTNLDSITKQLGIIDKPVKKYTLPILILAIAGGLLFYLSIKERQKNNFHNTSLYMLFAIFCGMSLAILLLLRVYNAYVKRREDRGEMIHKG